MSKRTSDIVECEDGKCLVLLESDGMLTHSVPANSKEEAEKISARWIDGKYGLLAG